MKTPASQPSPRRNAWQRRWFNMIEVILALIVVAIGMMSIIGLIPIGTKATRDAIGDSYSADLADSLLHQLLQNARVSDAAWNSFLATVPDISSTNVADLNPAVTDINGSDWTQIDGALYYSGPSGYTNKTVYRIYQTRYVEKGTYTGSIADFDAIVRIWKEPVTTSTYTSGGAGWSPVNLGSNNVVRLYLEMTWPATVAFEDRHRAYYSLEVTR